MHAKLVVQGGGAKGIKKHAIQYQRPKTLMPSGRTHRGRCVGLHTGTNASPVNWGINPCSGLHMERSAESVARKNHFKAVCRSRWRKQVSQQSKMLNKVQQEDVTSSQVPEDQDWSFDVIRVTYINLNSINLHYSLNWNLAQVKGRPK